MFLSGGLYAITAGEEVISATRAALAGGARLLQYRDKSDDSARRLAEAKALAALCREAGIPFLINDDIALARVVGADGVHLGRDDAAIDEARAILGANAIIGVSCYADLARAARLAAAGADYLAFGRFFPSRSKPDATPAPLAVLREARARFDLPLVAIGGITPENGATLIDAGADYLAVIDALFGQPDPRAAARAFQPLFHRSAR